MVGRPSLPSRSPPPAVSSRTKDYSVDRPTEVQNELDELRSRGLAKILNRFFDDTTKKLASEKAAADAALADLQRRRSNTSQFVPSNGAELGPFDAMYIELQRKRADCRRKERETLLLYQRYVHKYGKKARLGMPRKASNGNTSEDLSTDTSAVSTLDAPPPPSPLSVSPSGSELHPLDENVASGQDSKVGSQDVTGGQLDPANGGFANKVAKYEDFLQQRKTRRQLNGRGSIKGDPPADPPAVKFASQGQPNEKSKLPDQLVSSERNDDLLLPSDETFDENDSSRPANEVTTGLLPTVEDNDELDDRSIISGLTMNSQMTRQVLDDIEFEMENFLQTETEAVRKILDAEELDEASAASSYGDTPSGSCVGDEATRASRKAEAMAKEMQKILDDFAKDNESVSAQSEANVTTEKESVSTDKYPRKYNTGNPSDNWMVYYDDSHQREYYHETAIGLTQWEPPSSQGQSGLHMSELSMHEAPRAARVSRRDRYRKRLRKRRMRRAAAMFLFLLCLGGTVLHWQSNHADKTYPEAMVASWTSICSTVTYQYEQAKSTVMDSLENVLASESPAVQVTQEPEPKGVTEDELEVFPDDDEDTYVPEPETPVSVDEQTEEADPDDVLDEQLPGKEEPSSKMPHECEVPGFPTVLPETMEQDSFEFEEHIVVDGVPPETDASMPEEQAPEAIEHSMNASLPELSDEEESVNGELQDDEEVAEKGPEEDATESLEKTQKEEVTQMTDGAVRDDDGEAGDGTLLEVGMAENVEEPDTRRPWVCNIPLSHLHRRCRGWAASKPLFNEEDIVNNFLL